MGPANTAQADRKVSRMRRLPDLFRSRPDRVMMYMWACLAVPTVLWWKDSILWVALMSLFATFETSRAADKAAREQDKTE